MSYADALNSAGYKKEVSTAGDKPIMEGVYKCTLVDCAKMEDKGYGESVYGSFKISEVLVGRESNSQYPEFKDYYNLSPDKIANKRSGLAKLLNGLFSIGLDVDTSSDEALMGGLEVAKGAEVYIKGYKAKKMKKEGDGFVEVEGEFKQGYTFMTEKNAMKEVEKAKKGGQAPF